MNSSYIHSNPIPQRTHKKSTNGCVACKARKVKCDEKRPVCSKCAIHFANIKSCEYRVPTRSIKQSSAATSAKRKSLLPLPNGNSLFPLNDNGGKNIHTHNALYSLSSDQEKILVEEPQMFLSQREGREQTPQKSCSCPCHVPEFTSMLLDAVFGICRICGNLPSLDYPVTSCTPVVPSSMLMRNQIDPFHILPAESSPKVMNLIYHCKCLQQDQPANETLRYPLTTYLARLSASLLAETNGTFQGINTLALMPTKIHSQYCTNPTWLSTAIANPALFNATLYVCSVHIDSLHSKRQTTESLLYKSKTIKVLNEILTDPTKATSDETISAVLLLGNVLSIIGEPEEVVAHLRGLRKMVNLRGGIDKFSIDGCFLHMLCTTNHLSAVLSESLSVIPPGGITYKEVLKRSLPPSSPTSQSDSTSPSPAPSRPSPGLHVQDSPLLKAFGISAGFDETVVDLFYDMGYLYAVLDAFTLRLTPDLRQPLKDLVASIERGEDVAYVDPNPLRLSPTEFMGAAAKH